MKDLLVAIVYLTFAVALGVFTFVCTVGIWTVGALYMMGFLP
jgi:hypothetical protein